MNGKKTWMEALFSRALLPFVLLRALLSTSCVMGETSDSGQSQHVVNTTFDVPGDATGYYDMSDLIVYAFAFCNVNETDPQVYEQLVPDVQLRGWTKWAANGLEAEDYNLEGLLQCKEKNIVFVGGGTGSVLFREETESEEEFFDFATRDAQNQLVFNVQAWPSPSVRGSLANPKYRKHLLEWLKIQIDLGADGVDIDECNAGHEGGATWGWNGNEGYDDYFIEDFNRYLMQKYPAFMESDWLRKFGMSLDNVIKFDVPYNDLERNFNYRTYLKRTGWDSDPKNPRNPLAQEWRRTNGARFDPDDELFLNTALQLYWKDMIIKLRSYAREKYGKEIIISANGILPYVDMNMFGLYPHNGDDNGRDADYVPVTAGGHLNGSKSLAGVYKQLYKKNRKAAGNAPLVLFIDWPTSMIDDYFNLPVEEKKDYWRIYLAEAYACGLYFAFNLKTNWNDPTATESGVIDFMVQYSSFYKNNKDFYRNVVQTNRSAEINLSNIEYTITEQLALNRWLLHLINHNYDNMIFSQTNFTVSFVSSADPSSVVMYSPDEAGTKSVPFSRSGDRIIFNVDSLKYYDVLAVNW